MRINKYIAQATGLSRRAADAAIEAGRVKWNGQLASSGQQVEDQDQVVLDSQLLQLSAKQHTTIMLNKPAGYVVSRGGQGSPTVYDLLPATLHSLKPVGRLDKESSGLLLLTDDGDLAHQLTHPSFVKQKVYQIKLDKPLAEADMKQIGRGVELEDGLSHLALKQLGDDKNWQVTMTEGRNRQIRRTFTALGYKVIKLHRTNFGPYKLDDLKTGDNKLLDQ